MMHVFLLFSLALSEASYLQQCLTAVMRKIEPLDMNIPGNKTYAVEELVAVLALFNEIPPLTKINQECKPRDVQPQCSKWPKAFFPKQRDSPVKIGHIIQLGFDLDILEIHLAEIYDVVDKFFIIEATTMHNRIARKPLSWGNNKDTPRFRKYRDKIVHFVIDDAERISKARTVENTKSLKELFRFEEYQELARWERFRAWNAATGFFGPQDVIGFGDADEIPSRQNILNLKSCDWRTKNIDVGTLFLMSEVENSFQADAAIPGFPYSCGDPTFYKLATASEWNPPSRTRGHSPAYLLGGAHLTSHGYAAFLYLKEATATEYDSVRNSFSSLNALKDGKIDISTFEKDAYHRIVDHFRHRIIPTSQSHHILGDLLDIPWLLKCNPERYPTWFGKNDPRIYLTASDVSFTCEGVVSTINDEYAPVCVSSKDGTSDGTSNPRAIYY